MRNLALSIVVLCAGCSNPIGPTAAAAPQYPDEIRAVVEFLDTDTWRHPLLRGQRLGDYVRQHVTRIVVNPAMPDKWSAVMWPGHPILWWNPDLTAANVGMDKVASALLHEARHFDGYTHTCGEKDCTLEEGGAYAVQIAYLEHRNQQGYANELRQQKIGR
jgi:hypothetical protein